MLRCSPFKRRNNHKKRVRSSSVKSLRMHESKSSSRFYIADDKSHRASSASLNILPGAETGYSQPVTSAMLLSSKYDMFMQEFLESARNNNTARIREMIQLNKESTDDAVGFDINYRGKSKRFYGWTALHIACYFNLIDVIKLLLQVYFKIFFKF